MSNFVKGIIGDGFLTEIILTAFTRQIGISPEDTYVFAKSSGRCQELLEQYNVHAVQNSMVFAPAAKILILAVEPEEAIETLKQLFGKVSQEALIISLVEGLKLETITKYLPHRMIIRMITSPWIVSGCGVSTFIVGEERAEEASNIARAFLISLGEMIEVDTEQELETVGNLILSETVYIYLTVKSLIHTGKVAGLSADKSTELVMKVIGSGMKAMSSADELTESVVHRSYNKSNSNYLEKGKDLLDKYNIIANFQKSFSEPLEEKDIYKFHYRW